MALLNREHVELLPIHVNYGQLAEAREWFALRRFCTMVGLLRPVKVNVSGLGLIPSGLTRRSRRWRSDPFFPARNLILAAIGGSVGHSRGYRTIALGLVANTLYPDATKEFVRVTGDAISESLGARIQLIAPLLRFSKREVVDLGKAAHAPLSFTYSCQLGAPRPCRSCSSCRDRMAALNEPPIDEMKTHPSIRRTERGHG
jgi:7-cyano-7-deazaguanine synthase